MSLWNDNFFQNTNEIISGFLPWNFLYLPGGFLEAFWGLLYCRLPYLWYYLLSPQEAQRASRKPPGSCKKKSGQKSRNNFFGFLEEVLTPKGHFEINWPLVRQQLWVIWYQKGTWRPRMGKVTIFCSRAIRLDVEI